MFSVFPSISSCPGNKHISGKYDNNDILWTELCTKCIPVFLLMHLGGMMFALDLVLTCDELNGVNDSTLIFILQSIIQSFIDF